MLQLSMGAILFLLGRIYYWFNKITRVRFFEVLG
jgi:hypothetical protein